MRLCEQFLAPDDHPESGCILYIVGVMIVTMESVAAVSSDPLELL